MTDIPSQVPGRRTYKRYAAQVWEEHRETIRELFLELDKTHDELAAILAERYGLAVGARQLKRKTNEWGFVKNIPAKEMAKMVRARQRRQIELGRPTKFLRHPGAGGFQVIPAAKLDAYQKRHGVPSDSGMSQSSGLPSNIMCQTPSNYASSALIFGSRGVGSASALRSSDQMALDFNDSTERVFSNIRNNDANDNATATSSSEQSSRDGPIRELTIPHTSLYMLARENAFDGDYQSAAQKFKLLTQIFHNDWVRVVYQCCADVMDAACYPGCPQSLAARAAHILSQSLVREREKYSTFDSGIGGEAELRKVLFGLRSAAQYWGSMIVLQRAVQIWEPILGSDHPKVAVLRNNLALERSNPNLGSEESYERHVEGVETSALGEPLEIDQLPSLKTVGDILHLGDAPGGQLLEKLQAIESSSLSGQQLRLEVARLRFGRSRALLGVYYSFISRFWDAEKAFEDSERFMEHETCIEIKLHRMLWYAEHKTRVQDWTSVNRLIRRAHEVFMANDTVSEFIIDHFPGRFESLCLAASMRVSIDKTTSKAAADASSPNYRQTTSHQALSPIPGTPAFAHPSPGAEISVLSPERLFPPTPRGANAEINIDAWRQFVHFTPAIGTPESTGIN